jgi:hypothetical protein
VGVTTNENLERLHPAVVRPGRCLARIEVGALTHAESLAWLERDAAPWEGTVARAGATLAELYAMRRGRVRLPAAPAPRTEEAGLYL